MQTVPQNKDKFTINNLFYCCKALIFTHPSVYEFLCGLIFMGHPVKTKIKKSFDIYRKSSNLGALERQSHLCSAGS